MADNNKVLYTRFQIPCISLDTVSEEIKQTKSLYGELLLCKESAQDNFSIKIGDGIKTIQQLPYFVENWSEYINKVDKIQLSDDYKSDYPLDMPRTLSMQNDDGSYTTYKIRLCKTYPAQYEANTLYFLIGDGYA